MQDVQWYIYAQFHANRLVVVFSFLFSWLYASLMTLYILLVQRMGVIVIFVILVSIY
jgi:hypothetical protein